MTDDLDSDAAHAIIRRAAELDSSGTADGLQRTALEEAAAEAGISPTAVHQALAEYDAGVLAPLDDVGGLLGPARYRAVRTVDLSPAASSRLVDKWLRSQMLEINRHHAGATEWRRRGDLLAKFRRRIDPGRMVRLGGIDGITVSVAGAGDGRSTVRLDATLDDTRRGLLTGVVAIPAAAGPVLGGAAALVVGEPIVFLAGFPTGAMLGGVGLYAGRRTLRAERDRAGRALELFLDELDRGS